MTSRCTAPRTYSLVESLFLTAQSLPTRKTLPSTRTFTSSHIHVQVSIEADGYLSISPTAPTLGGKQRIDLEREQSGR